jgi:hypothetical protein
MGFKSGKTIHRDAISGLHIHDDVQDGTHSVNELRSRMDSRQQSLNDAIKADWPADQLSTNADIEHPTYGNAGKQFPRPTDKSSKGDDRYGVSVSPGKQVAKAARSDSEVSK